MRILLLVLLLSIPAAAQQKSPLPIPETQKAELRKAYDNAIEQQKLLELQQKTTEAAVQRFNALLYKLMYDIDVPKGYQLNFQTWVFEEQKK